MKTLLVKNEDRMHKQDAWKKSAYAFVPYSTHFGELCGFADDVVAPGQGFGMHPHAEMEICTIMLQGAQAHKDSTGKEGMLHENSVQTMTAGTGIRHSEFNASDTQAFHSFQIWVYPKVAGLPPQHSQFSFEATQKHNRVLLSISPDGREGTATINQDAFFSLSSLEAGASIPYAFNLPGNGVYLHCATGSVKVAGVTLRPGDAVGIHDAGDFVVEGIETAELIFVEVPMKRGIHR